ncbi:START domain-containing proteins involved in steroidogenesis/phosphatidylcholine transfer protein [Dioscorea alata]|uniref:START domain-containing proteins involved in steroidogenesis/phosphatidylcholine transfer protein n=1 Tax=Dioscorea alata TaxID=55571 RepID=A0ACB7V482_DIOAL|nr:START domain-containing proteins involved in steroidogenesis/phosphatidylcholine transfer protein [Dioscorea alata]
MAMTTETNLLVELALLSGPISVAVLIGLLLGWAWKPKWAVDLVGGLQQPTGLPRLDSMKPHLPSFIASFIPDKVEPTEFPPRSTEMGLGSRKLAVMDEDLEYLHRLVELTDGGPVWLPMMERSLPSFSYQAWRRDPESGPPQYRSKTIFEDATPEIVRDLFWDDEFRLSNKWDDMLIYHSTLEECPITGTMVVHWLRKFPFFCSDREYIIGRRIWKFGNTYYCVTKGDPNASVPRRNKPRRVDLYYSSWCIRPAESIRGNGQRTACEVLLFHYEDMGIPWEIAKLGVRQGMWGCVKKIEPGLRAYQIARRSGKPLSRCGTMAQINTSINANYFSSLEDNNGSSDIIGTDEKPSGRNIPRLIVVGGAIALACTLDGGLLTKAIIFGVARRFAWPRRAM